MCFEIDCVSEARLSHFLPLLATIVSSWAKDKCTSTRKSSTCLAPGRIQSEKKGKGYFSLAVSSHIFGVKHQIAVLSVKQDLSFQFVARQPFVKDDKEFT